MEEKEMFIKIKGWINSIFQENTLGESYLILRGLELVGIKNASFWFDVVSYVKKYQGSSALINYINAMEKIQNEDLQMTIAAIQDKFPSFESAYLVYLNLLSRVLKIDTEISIKN